MLRVECDGNLLADMIDCLDVVTNEIILQVSETEWKIVAVDAANVSLMKYVISTDKFESYTWADESDKFGISIKSLYPFRANLRKAKWVMFECDARKFTLTIDNVEYKGRLIDVKTIRKSPSLPNPWNDEYSTVTVSTSVFKDIVKNSSLLPECAKVILVSNEDTFTATYENDLKEQVVLTFGGISADGKNQRVTYALNYIKHVVKIINSEEVEMTFKTDGLLRLKWGCVEYMLAPRIEKE